MAEIDVAELIPRALGGDQKAWHALVNGLTAVIVTVARRHRLGEADISDLCQNTWLSLTQELSGLREPRCLPGWLATTARRQALRLLACRKREAPDGRDEDTYELVAPSPELIVLSAERDRVLWESVARLPARHRRLMWLMATEPGLTHQEIAAELGICPSSVGRLQKRCLARLRHLLLAEGYEHR